MSTPPDSPAAPSGRDPLIGRTLHGRYLIHGVLGTGGFSVVYRAEHVAMGKALAVKVLPSDHQHAEWLRPRFEREAQLLATLSHPNIVSIVDYGMDGDIPYLAMDLVEGELLRDVLDREALATDRALRIARQILQGLACAHGLGVMHRDLKPSNILLASLPGVADHVKILDFGFGKFFGRGAPAGLTPITDMDKAFGTPGYLAPERLAGKPLDERADVYSAGAILFELLSGRRPFEGNALEVLQAHMEQPVPTLARVRPDLSFVPELDDVIQRAMAKDPGDRFPDAQRMLEALESAASSPPVAGSRPPPPPRNPLPAPPEARQVAPRSSPLLRAAVVVVLLLTATAIGWAVVAFFSGRPG